MNPHAEAIARQIATKWFSQPEDHSVGLVGGVADADIEQCQALQALIEQHLGNLLDAADGMAVEINSHCKPDCPMRKQRNKYLAARDAAMKEGE